MTRLDDLCDLGGLSFSGLRCAGMSSIEGLSAANGTMRLSGNGERFWLRRSEMSSGLTSDDMEAGGIEGGPGDCFLTWKMKKRIKKGQNVAKMAKKG